VTLAELAALNRRLLAEGVAIQAINAQRRARSRIKGGALIERLQGRAGCALLLSDVPGDDPAVIGSGLAGPARGDRLHRVVIASNDDAVGAAAGAARAAGLSVQVGEARFDGDAAALGARFAQAIASGAADVFVWGGESTVRLPPAPGRGGRNQQLALAAARALQGQRGLTLLAAGTDGTDGPTEDAGAMVDGGTWQRIRDAGLDGEDCLARADAGAALEAAGDLLHTGATGTNVGDLVIGLARVL
jgi:hydroxypyruvate reductase